MGVHLVSRADSKVRSIASVQGPSYDDRRVTLLGTCVTEMLSCSSCSEAAQVWLLWVMAQGATSSEAQTQ